MAYQIKQSDCSCCHLCRIHCPVQAITFKNAKYWIDETKCISCGKCVSVCHNGCISNPEKAALVVPHEPIKLECDVCVIGAGASGLVAAAKASDMGSSVVILEKNHEIGGSAWYATGFGCHYSKLHKAAGKKDTREELYQQFISKLGDQVDTKLLKRLFKANGDWIDWMVDEHDFEELYTFNPKGFGNASFEKKRFVPWNDKRIDGMIGPGGAGWIVCSKLYEDLNAKGVPIMCSTAAKKLLLDETGTVCGVAAEDAGGKVEVRCKSIVVATGAFTRNKEIMARMQPAFYKEDGSAPIHVFTCSTCTGDGIAMCEGVGADIDYTNRRVNMFGPMRHPYPSVTLNCGSGPMFYTSGKRYIEKGGMKEVSQLAYDPDRYVWKIVSDAGIEANMNKIIKQGKDTMIGIDMSHFAKNWRQVIEEEAADHSVIIGDTIEDLARKLGFDPNAFAEEIKAYNKSLWFRKPAFLQILKMMPKSGGMPDMSEVNLTEIMEMMGGAKVKPLNNGPFYAVKMKLFHENSIGGMVIDQNTAVLKNGEPIEGLFAAGDTTRGIMVPGDIGVRYIEMVFSALTYAFNSGYISGTEAANHALGIIEKSMSDQEKAAAVTAFIKTLSEAEKAKMCRVVLNAVMDDNPLLAKLFLAMSDNKLAKTLDKFLAEGIPMDKLANVYDIYLAGNAK